MKLCLLRGVPASGKTTYAKGLVEEGWTRVSRDDIRYSMFGKGWGVPEDIVTDVESAMIQSSLAQGQDVVVDATNLMQKSVQTKLSIAAEFGADVLFLDFPIALDLAIARDIERTREDRSVGEKVIRDFFTRYKINPGTGVLKAPPALWPKFEAAAPYDETKVDAYIVDTDGTVADATGLRGWYDHNYEVDRPQLHTIEAVNGLWERGFEIIGLSGRDEEFRYVTEQWWRDHDINYDKFFMRERGDTRNDALVKYEIFKRDIEPHYNVLGAFDDRPRVLRMWRAIGVPTLQIGSGREF